MKRVMETNEYGYQEVNLSYRKNRAAYLESKKVGVIKGRLVCPMIAAARSDAAYGSMFLPTQKNNSLQRLANAIKLDKKSNKLNRLISIVAYSSNKWYNIPKNILTSSFSAEGINTGLIFDLKKNVHTGIFENGQFNQDRFNKFIWNLYPNLQGTAIDNDFVYSSKGDGLYFYETELEKVVAFNKTNSTAKDPKAGIKLSTFEMKDLLLGILGQKITKDGKAIQAISVRDIHDLYKYGLVTGHIEDELMEADLLTMPTF